jgi:hypothetical protein
MPPCQTVKEVATLASDLQPVMVAFFCNLAYYLQNGLQRMTILLSISGFKFQEYMCAARALQMYQPGLIIQWLRDLYFHAFYTYHVLLLNIIYNIKRKWKLRNKTMQQEDDYAKIGKNPQQQPSCGELV